MSRRLLLPSLLYILIPFRPFRFIVLVLDNLFLAGTFLESGFGTFEVRAVVLWAEDGDDDDEGGDDADEDALDFGVVRCVVVNDHTVPDNLGAEVVTTS